MAFLANAYVLTGTGINLTFKSIKDINPGDTVYNMRMEPVIVKSTHEKPISKIVEIRHENWYTPLYCSSNQELLTMNGDQISILPADKIEPDMKFTFEKNIYSDLRETFENGPYKPSQEMGIFLGLYCGYGTITETKVEFRFGPNNDLVNQVAGLISSIFNVSSTIIKEKFCYKVQSESQTLIEFFKPFGDKFNRCLPKKYWAKNPEYIAGLYQGMIEYDPETKISRFIPISRLLAEAFMWICNELSISFENDTPTCINEEPNKMTIYPLFIRNAIDDATNSSIKNITILDKSSTGYTLGVECPSNSFIVNNIVAITHE
jgi:hypothetical protein